MLGAPRWTLGAPRWTLGAMRWMLGAQLWTLGAPRWMLRAPDVCESLSVSGVWLLSGRDACSGGGVFGKRCSATASTSQSQSLNRNIPHPPANRSPSTGIYRIHRPIAVPQQEYTASIGQSYPLNRNICKNEKP
eukprot:674151-Prorocentrum_minimum.AAC.1